MPEELGDLDVKINEIVNEGFVSSLAKGLLPSALQKVIDTPYKNAGDVDPVELARTTYKKYGHNPEYVDPKTGKPLFPDQFGYMTWLTPYDLYSEKSKIVGQMSDADKMALPDAIKAQLGIRVSTPTSNKKSAPTSRTTTSS